jgi:hypothetical protein
MNDSADSGKFTGLFVFLSAFLLYLVTLAPTFLWSDSAKLAINVAEKQYAATSFGAHPMHTLLGLVFSWLPFSLAYTQNLMSAVFASGALFFVYSLIREETRDKLSAILAAGALGVSHLFWMYAVINETYSLLAFCFSATLYFVLKYSKEGRIGHLFAAAFLIGVGFANHGMMILFLPGLCVLLIRRETLKSIRFQHALLLLLFFLLGGSPVFLFPLFHGQTPATIIAGLRETTEDHYHTFNSGFSKLVRQLGLYPFYLLYQFPGAGLVLALYGVRFLRKDHPRLLIGTLILFLTTILFASQYFLQRQFPMLIPSFLIFAIWIGYGFAGLRNNLFRSKGTIAAIFLLLLVAPPVIYYASYHILERKYLGLAFIRKLPYRNNFRYFFYPPKEMERGAELYVMDSFRQAEPGAIILTDFNPGMALLYGQKVLGQRKDLEIAVLIDEWVHHSDNPANEVLKYVREKTSQNRTVYLADRSEPYYHSSILIPEFELVQSGGPLWKIQKRGE